MICVRKGPEPYPVENSKGQSVMYDARYWVPVEPAPDTKFRPVCFYNWSEPLGTCQMSELESFVADHLQCKICPFGKFAQSKETAEIERSNAQ